MEHIKFSGKGLRYHEILEMVSDKSNVVNDSIVVNLLRTEGNTSKFEMVDSNNKVLGHLWTTETYDDFGELEVSAEFEEAETCISA